MLKSLTTQREMRNTVSFHLGGDALVAERFHVRGGVFYEPLAFGDQTFSVAVPDDTTHTCGRPAVSVRARFGTRTMPA